MMYVYRVNVRISTGKSDNKLFVTKDVIKARVVKTGSTYIYVTSLPESYGDVDSVKISKEECFTELADANKEADRKAALLVTVLTQAIETLNQPAMTLDKYAE